MAIDRRRTEGTVDGLSHALLPRRHTNGDKNGEKITALLRRYRGQKR
ncbi:hypothetical protein [Microbispora sp. H10836]|nr:hypothetical protein [Microbispora sp. H10836]